MKIAFSIAIIIAFISTSLWAQKKPVTLEDMWITYSFYPSSIDEFNSMNDGESYTQLTNKSTIEQFSLKTGKLVKKIFSLDEIPASDEKPNAIASYEFSNDESKILFSSGQEKIYRHSFKADYWIWDLKTKKVQKLSNEGKQMLANFSPDGLKVAFVRDNNMYYKDLVLNKEFQITNDGKWAEIINGAPDWVYEEEFSFSKAFEWSPDGNFIAYMKFDESKVKEFNMTMYGTLYPDWYNYKYPKAGEDNSKVSLHVYQLSSSKNTEIECGKVNDQYIPRIKWTAQAGVLSFIRLNRLQNHLELIFTDVNTGKSYTAIDEKNKNYLEITDNWEFVGNNQIIWYSDKSGYNHLYRYDYNGTLINQITQGNFDVTKYNGFDAKTNTVFYTSSEESPIDRQCYKIVWDGTGKQKLTNKSGHNSVQLIKGAKYIVNTYSSSDIPETFTLMNPQGKEIRVLENNEALVTKMKDYNFSKKEFFTFTNSEGVLLHGWMIKPADFDPDKKYPVFMSVYGGPGSQEVLNQWNYTDIWHQVIAQKGYIVVSIDGRGTGARGSEFKQITYGNLGKYEAIDQSEGAKYLATLPYVESKRIGIYGWSFGGYLSSLSLFLFPDLFKMAIAVAPVTNWRYYDSIYTERYNGLPKDNADGYDKNSPINHVKKLKGRFLLVHGTADDNVHFQNSMEMVSKLVEANKKFDSFFYPNSNHGIYTGRNTRYHLFTQMTDYILENL